MWLWGGGACAEWSWGRRGSSEEEEADHQNAFLPVLPPCSASGAHASVIDMLLGISVHSFRQPLV